MTRGTTTAVTSILLPGNRVEDILKFAIDWSGELWDRPATPEILVYSDASERDRGFEPNAPTQMMLRKQNREWLGLPRKNRLGHLPEHDRS